MLVDEQLHGIDFMSTFSSGITWFKKATVNVEKKVFNDIYFLLEIYKEEIPVMCMEEGSAFVLQDICGGKSAKYFHSFKLFIIRELII